MVRVELNLSKSVPENANFYFNKSKKLKNKLPGIERTLDRTKQEIEKLDSQKKEFENKQIKKEILKK